MNDDYRRSRFSSRSPRDQSYFPSMTSPSGVPYQTSHAVKEMKTIIPKLNYDVEAGLESGDKSSINKLPCGTIINDSFAQEVLSMNQLMPDFSPTVSTKSIGTNSEPPIPVSLKNSEEKVSSDSKERMNTRKDNTTLVEILPKLTKQNYQMSYLVLQK